MDIGLAFLFVFLGLLVLLLASPSFLSSIRSHEERNLTPLFQEWCAVQRDSGSGSSVGRNMFLWRVSLYPDFMVLALFSRDLIPYRQIERVEIKSFQDSEEVWLYRHVDQAGELITVRSKNTGKIIKVFASVGVPSNAVRSQSEQRF